jgi:hypothetical protein
MKLCTWFGLKNFTGWKPVSRQALEFSQCQAERAALILIAL